MRLAVIRLGILAVASLAYSQDDELRRAAELDAAQRCDDAERLYRQALAKAPLSVPVLNNIGNHYLICKQPEKAELHFVRLLKINPSHTNANLQLARLATDRKRGAAALQYLSKVKDTSPAIRLLRAEASQYAGRDAEALSIVEALQQEANSDPRVLFALGITCARLGLYDKAEDAFNRVLATRPNDFNVLFNLGRAAARAQHYDRAQRALEVAVKMQAEDVDALLELGLVYAAQQDYSRSVYVLAQARQRAPKRPDVLLALARAAEDAGFYGDSALAYDEYLEINSADATARRDRGRVIGQTDNRLNEGIQELTLYVQKHPKDPIGHYYLAQLVWTTKPAAALEQLSTALSLDPNFTPAHYSRGWLLHRLGRTSDSLVNLKEAVRLQPNNVRVLDQLGLTYLSLEQPSEAEKVLRRAVTLAPQDPEVLMHLGRSLVALNREDEGQRYLDHFQKLRSEKARDPRREAGMFELATMPQAERTQLQINRLRQDSRAHPGDPELALHLAGLLLSHGQTEEAMSVYRELLARDADSAIWQQAGTTLARAGQYQMARDFLKGAVVDLPKARLDLAIALFFTDGPEHALKAMNEVSEGDQDGDFLLMKARILDAIGRPGEAEKVLQEGLRRSSTRADVAQQAVALLLARNRMAEALNVISNASRANPDNPDLLLTQAIVLALADRPRESEQLLKKVESRWPEWDRAYVVHGLVLESSGRTAEARQKLQTATALAAADVATRCALARLNRDSSPTTQCGCANGLRDLVVPSCR
jgi:tetratricopeptide (TPR) repeat protein